MISKRKLIASDIVMLDPMDCGSDVAYVVGLNRYGKVYGDISLSDCNRKITWYFDKNDIAKIDKAVAILQSFRKIYSAAVSKRTRRKK
jgi:hypothetical protein